MEKYVVTDKEHRIIAVDADNSLHSNGFIFNLPDDFNSYYKFDYKIVGGQLVYDPFPRRKNEKIAELKSNLERTDYMVIKQIEGAPISEQEQKHYDAVIKERQKWRDEINRLEKEGA